MDLSFSIPISETLTVSRSKNHIAPHNKQASYHVWFLICNHPSSTQLHAGKSYSVEFSPDQLLLYASSNSIPHSRPLALRYHPLYRHSLTLSNIPVHTWSVYTCIDRAECIFLPRYFETRHFLSDIY